MATYLERYQSGEHAQVWTELVAHGGAVRVEPLLTDATRVADETMRRVRHNVEVLVPRLESIGYQFGYYGEGDPIPNYSGPLSLPSTDTAAQIQQLEDLTGPVPSSLRAWYEVVGSVDFCGWHPEWAVAYHDPLCVDSFYLGYIQSEVDEWEEMCEEEGEEEVGPFVLPFAPDFYHKQNVSGGSPYGIALPNAAADAPVENEWHETTFVNYLRICFRWGGFPGFEMVTEEEQRPLSQIEYLTRNLLPI